MFGIEEELEFTPITGRDRKYNMTMQKWLDDVESGFLIDDDGFGVLATSEKASNIDVHPSMVKATGKLENIPEWATHIMWYNK